jgi:RNA-binding protein NOB1
MPSAIATSPTAPNGQKHQPPAASPPLHLEHLVIDAGAIISGQGFGYFNAAKKFWSVREVIDEIRDSKARHLLSTLPFEIEIRAPSDKAMKAVAEFAKKTGDLAQLSLNDLKILALTYDLEYETTGGASIRAEPKVFYHYATLCFL